MYSKLAKKVKIFSLNFGNLTLTPSELKFSCYLENSESNSSNNKNNNNTCSINNKHHYYSNNCWDYTTHHFLFRVGRTKVDSDGNTALHSGAAGGVSGVCWAVLYPGSEHLLTTTNAAGLTPAQVAHASISVLVFLVKHHVMWKMPKLCTGRVYLPVYIV